MILVVDDEEAHAEATAEALSRSGHQCVVATSGGDALGRLDQEDFHVVVTDLVMPGIGGLQVLDAARKKEPPAEVILMTAHATVETCKEALQRGAADYVEKPFDIGELRAIVAKASEKAALARRNVELEKQIDERFGFTGIIGQSPQMLQIFDQLKLVAPTTANVLITGESGTGKEIIAKAIHNNSPRRHYNFAPINCAAISESLLESELFGHEKGSFTGAATLRKGRFEYAHKGTLFLDEVSSMPLAAQAKLLRAIEEREITRVGSNEPLRVDVRIVAATNRELQKLVEEEAFRNDLYFRLNVVTIDLPPLRERKEDIPLLLDYFVRELAKIHGKTIKEVTPAVRQVLAEQEWPGNVRELRNWVENMTVLTRDDVLGADDLPSHVERLPVPAQSLLPLVPTPGMTLAEAERNLIKATLDAVDGNREEAAKRLGIGERTLYRKIDRYELK